jgi:uncharacterized protein (DUF488 family)
MKNVRYCAKCGKRSDRGCIQLCRKCSGLEEKAEGAPLKKRRVSGSNEIYTIGYGSYRTMGLFIDRLTAHHVESLIDIRYSAKSAKPGFSKASLQKAMVRKGISYFHFSALGSTPAERQELESTGDYLGFFDSVQRRIEGESKLQLNLVAMHSMSKRTALMCACGDATRCHRLVVSELIARIRGSFVFHL